MIHKKIILEKNQKCFFTSDLHFSHKNICKGTTSWDLSVHGGDESVRDFKTPEEMNNVLINNINKMVGQNDWLIHLGDWSFKSADEIYKNRDRIVCKNIVHILGNHCEKIAKNVLLSNGKNAQEVFESVHAYLELVVSSPEGKTTYNMMHFPLAVWNKAHHNRIMLHGHCHASFQHEGRSLDVGVDKAFELYGEYRPFSQEDIRRFMNKREFKQFSHHNKNTN